ncbi:HEAT repeat domain-containing protein [Amycolatopsis sp. NPDC004378]
MAWGDHWSTMLRDLSGDSFEEACEQLSDTLVPRSGWNPDAADALPGLLGYVEDPDAGHRADVFQIVYDLARRARDAADERWGSAWAAAVPRLVALLGDPVRDVRRAAALVLGEHPDPEVLRALLDRWPGEESEAVRLGYVIAIGELGGADVLPWLAERDESYAIQAVAVTTTARITGEAPIARLADLLSRDMTAFAGMHTYERPVPVHWAAGQLAPKPREALLVALSSRPERRSQAVDVALGEVADRPSAVEGLLPIFGAMLDSPERATAAAVLGGVAPASVEYADRLFALADDTTAAGHQDEVRDFALWALLRLKDRRCVEPLLARFGSRKDVFMRGGIPRMPGHWSRFDALGAHETLMDAPEFAPEFLPWIGETLDRSVNRFTIWPLTRLLQAWGPAGAPATGHVARQLGADDPLTVEWCADTLAEIGGDSALPALRKVVKGRRRPWKVRAAAATAFARLGGDPAAALNLLEEGIKAGEASALGWTASLGTIGAPLESTLRRCGPNEEWAEVALAHALGRVTGDVEEVLPVLLRKLDDVQARWIGFPVTRAMRALATLGPLPAQVAPVLRELLARDERFSASDGCALFRADEAFRRDAARALANCAG